MNCNLLIAFSITHSTQWILGDETIWSAPYLSKINYNPEDWVFSFVTKAKDFEYFEYTSLYQQAIMLSYIKNNDYYNLTHELIADSAIFLADLKAIKDGNYSCP